MLDLDPITRPIHKQRLIVANRRPKNIKELIVTSKLRYPPREPGRSLSKDGKSGYNACPKVKTSHCPWCQCLDTSGICISHTYRTTVICRVLVTCRSSNLVYVLNCTKCLMQYIGETKNEFRERLRRHVYDVKNIGRIRGCDTNVARHFNLPGHDASHIRPQILEFIRAHPDHPGTTETRRKVERHFIIQLGTLRPNGINGEE